MLVHLFPDLPLVYELAVVHQGCTKAVGSLWGINAFRRLGFAGFARRGQRWAALGGARKTRHRDQVHRVAEVARREVGVRIGGEPGVLVAQDFLHRRQARAAHDGVARQRVTGVVEPDLAGAPRGPEFHIARGATAGLGVEVPLLVAAPLAPALVIVVVHDAGSHHGGPQNEFEVQLPRPHLAVGVRKQQRPRGGQPRAYVLDELLVDRHRRRGAALGGIALVRAADEKHSSLEVDVLFLQRKDFPAPQAREQRHGEHPAPVLGQGGQHGGNLVRGQDVVPALGHLARVRLLGGVIPRPAAVLFGDGKNDAERGPDAIDAPRAGGLAAYGDRLGELGEVLGELSARHRSRLERTQPRHARRLRVRVPRVLEDAIAVAGRPAQVFEMDAVGPVAEFGKRAAEQRPGLEPVVQPLVLLLELERELARLGRVLDAAQHHGFPRAVGLFDLGVPSDFTTGQRARINGGHQRLGIRMTLPLGAGQARRSAYSRTRAGKYRITPPSFA